MRVPSRPLRALAIVLAITSIFAQVQVSQAQGIVPTPEQLDILRNMSPEERDALMQQLGIDPSIFSTDNQTRTGRDTGATTASDSNRMMSPSFDEQTLDRQRQFLKAEDWVLIEVDFQLPPRVESLLQPMPVQPSVPGATPGPVGSPTTPASAPAAPTTTPPAATPEHEVKLSAEEQELNQKLIDLIRAKNPYQLSREGVLLLPGFQGIALAGLTERQASLRLQADPSFRNLEIRLTRLPLDKAGPQALKPFGYDLFDQSPSTFAPVTDVPVPADYIIGPGDELHVQLYGSENRSFRLIVDRAGSIDFPQLGPIHVSGLRFNTAKENIEARVQRQISGVQASISMGDTRSIRVFVMGEAKRPGSYTISGLGTMTSALYAAGGVKSIGSLRDLQLKRQGRLIRRLDLYDLLLRGDTSDDATLLSGDVIFVPPVGPTAAIYGEVQRPAIYELKGETSVADLIAVAGGLTAEADTSRAALTQIDAKQRRVVVDVNLAPQAAASQHVRGGDLLRVSRLRPTLDSGIVLRGHLFTPGAVAYRDGLRLSQVITSVDDLQPNADIHYLLIRRELPPDRRVAALSADLAAALAAPGSRADIELAPRDQITVFDLQSGRDRIIQPLLEELRLQAGIDHPTEVVTIDGRAKVPGEYPLEPGMRISDLMRAGGGLEDAAYGATAELSRYSVGSGEARRTELIIVDLAAVLRHDPAADVQLQPFDTLSIREVPNWEAHQQVTLAGEVRFPGKYSLKPGETIKSVLARAGGLTEYAYAEGSVLTRKELREREQQQLDVLALRLQNDLATMALQGAAANQAQAGTALTVGQSLLSQLRTSKAVGRLVIDLPRTLRAEPGSPADLLLRDGDELIIPKQPQEVTVLGEVQNATSHLYRENLTRDDYISLSGGATRKADRSNIYVVRADGSVIANGSSRWFRRGGQIKVRPGDTVVVPLDTERLPALPFWQAVTQILYNVAISAAVVNRF